MATLIEIDPTKRYLFVIDPGEPITIEEVERLRVRITPWLSGKDDQILVVRGPVRVSRVESEGQ